MSGVKRDSDSTATATLSWSWPLGSGWRYQSTAPMKLVGQAWQVTWSPKIVEPSLDGTTTLDASTVGAKRGDILGPGGVGLVTDRPVVRFGVDRTKVGPAAALDSARRLAQLVGIDVASYVKQVKASGPKAFIPAIVFRKEAAPSNLVGRATAIKGVDALSGQTPLGITKEFAAPILGTVGPVTADMIKQNPGVYQVGDVAGLSGLEARYDAQLRGTPGVQVDSVGADGKRHTLFETKPVNGTPLKLTMVPRLQLLAEHLLSTVGPASAIVAIRPSTGAILAAANGPGNNGYNDATYGRFAPGSTFKTVDSLALAKKGVTPQSTVDCPTSVNVNGKIFTNDSFYPSSANGRISLATALANSCNTTYINERTHLGDHDLVDAAATLGMGVDHDLGFPAYFGNVVPPTSETEKAADMIGQGQILASPMTMATVLASVVAGHTVVPQLITSVNPAKTPSAPLTAHAGRDPEDPAAGGGHQRHRDRAPGRPRPTGDRQDRDRGVRPRRQAADPRVDDRSAGRPRRVRLRRRRYDGRRHRRAAPRGVPARRPPALSRRKETRRTRRVGRYGHAFRAESSCADSAKPGRTGRHRGTWLSAGARPRCGRPPRASARSDRRTG